jgi:hypothetical protein
VPIPDTSALQGAINTEAGARAAGDAALQANIDAEAGLRGVMDSTLQTAIEELRPRAIAGTYTFSGTQTCISSTFGFNEDLTPASSPDPTRAAVVSQFAAISSGTRIFNADGTGTTQVSGFSMNFPGAFYLNPLPPGFPTAGVATGGPNAKPAGGAGGFEQAGVFTWRVEGNELIIQDGEASGTITQGGTTQGCTVRAVNLPPSKGTLGKDLGIITMIPSAIQQETSITECSDGRRFSTPRICYRERLLRKM